MHDVTGQIERLGNPYKKRYPGGEFVYARNIWDMQVFEGRLYIGAGNSSNEGPASNAGPVPVISLDPKTGQFSEVFTVDDEQIDTYCVLNGRLCIPGHDPTESWELGNFYRLEEGGTWKKYRNIPDTVHTSAMLYSGGILFAGGSGFYDFNDPAGERCFGSNVAVSSNEGNTWRRVDLGGYRTHALFKVADRVYAADLITDRKRQEEHTAYWARWGVPQMVCANIYEFDGRGAFQARTDLDASAIFPDTRLPESPFAKIVKPAPFAAKALYIGGLGHNDHQFMPFGLFVASSLRKDAVDVRRIRLPENVQPWDVLVRNGKAYVLLNSLEDHAHVVRVMATTDLEVWTEVLHFRAPTFARSFEVLDGDFYFGLGCEVADPDNWKAEELHPDTGEILRIRPGK